MSKVQSRKPWASLYLWSTSIRFCSQKIFCSPAEFKRIVHNHWQSFVSCGIFLKTREVRRFGLLGPTSRPNIGLNRSAKAQYGRFLLCVLKLVDRNRTQKNIWHFHTNARDQFRISIINAKFHISQTEALTMSAGKIYDGLRRLRKKLKCWHVEDLITC